MAATGRYKSRLLNYVMERSQEFKSQAARGFRYARTGLNWGAQALLYPIYVAFQTSRVVGRRLQSATGPKQFVQLPKPPDADSPLQELLKQAQAIADQEALSLDSSQSSTLSTGSVPAQTITLETAAQVPLTGDIWELEMDGEVAAEPASAESALVKSASGTLSKTETIEHPLSQDDVDDLREELGRELDGELAIAAKTAISSNSIYIRGVASNLKDRAIVLADNHNRLVTVAAEQQWELQQQIVRQVADFAYRQRQYRLRTQRRQQPLPPPKSDRPNLFPVVRWSRDLMGWMQRSPVAQKANLFSERQLPATDNPPTFPLPAWDPEASMAMALTTLQRVDAPLAQLEHNLEETYSQQIEPGPVGQLIRQAAAFLGLGSDIQSAAEETSTALSNAAGPIAQAAPSSLEQSPPVGLDADSALQFILGQAQAIADQEAITQEAVTQEAITTGSQQLQGTESPALNSAAGPLAPSNPAQPLTAATSASAPAPALVAEGDRLSLAAVMEGGITTTASGKVYIRGIASALENRALLLIDNQNRPIAISAGQQWALQTQIVGQVSGFLEVQQTLQAQPQTSFLSGQQAAQSIGHSNSHSLEHEPDHRSTNQNITSSQGEAVAALPSDLSSVTNSSLAAPESSTATSSEAPIIAANAGSSAPTWKASYIETTATFTEYIKHPLEWVLEKLDRWLLRIEQAIASIWHWIQLRLHPNR